MTDPIIAIVGGDYITFDKIDLLENAANTTATIATNNMTEYGYAFFKASATDGAQNNTVSNCVVTLNKTNTNTIGIYIASHGLAGVSTAAGNIAPTSAAGTNSNNKIYSNTLTNVADGIVINGSNTANYNDTGNDIGGTSVATGNTVTNFGGGAAGPTQPTALAATTVLAIYTVYQQGMNISYNTVNGGAATTCNINGIFNAANDGNGTNPGSSLNNNTIIMNCSVTTNQINLLKSNAGGATAVTNMNNNTLTLVANSLTSGNFYGIISTGPSSAVLNVNNNTLTNFNVLPAASASGAVYFINTQTGAHTLENVKGNIIQNNNVFTSGGIYGINTTASVANLRINNNLFVNDSTPSLTTTWYNIYNTGSVSATDSICNNTINMGTFTGVSHSGSVYGVYTASGTLDTITINNNILQNQNYLGATGGTGTTYYLYSSSTPGKLTIQNNNYNNMTVKTTGTLYFIYVPGTASLYTTVSNNGITTGYTRVGAGSGTVYLTYCYSSNTAAPVGSFVSYYNNNFSNFNNGTSTGTVYCGYVGGGESGNIYNNTWNNITAASGTGSIYGLYAYYYSKTFNIYGNTWSNITYGTGTMYGLYFYGFYSGAANVYSNTFSNFTSAGAAIKVLDIYYTGYTSSPYPQTNYNFYKNKITDITSTSASAVVDGIRGDYNYYGGNVNIYNNLVGNLNAPNSTNASAVNGITLANTSGSAAPVFNVSYNTVNLTGTSVGVNFGSSGVNVTSTFNTYRLRNNIFINTCVPTGTGKVVGLRLNTTSLTNFASESNTNNYYAGTPSGNNLVMFDGTNSYQTLASFQTAVAPREASSLSVTAAFLSTVGSNATFLHIDPLVTTPLEGGAVNIIGITDDYDADIRAGNPGYVGTGGSSPDMGADEFNGSTPAPSILTVARTPLGNQCAATARTVTATVKIGSVPVTSVTLNYSFNGTAQTAITMTLTGGTNATGNTTTWTGVIPAAVPTNAIVAWNVTATDGVYSKNATGTGYQDNPLLGLTATATASPIVVCSGANDTLNVTVSNPLATMPTGYCPNAASNTGDEEITGVTFGTINNASVCASLTGTQGVATGTADKYSNWVGSTVPVPTIGAGSTYPIGVQVTECLNNVYGNQVIVYFDFNRNGILTDPGESFIVYGPGSNGVVNNATSTITVPATASIGPTLMRVVSAEGSVGGPCSAPSWGEVEDYTVNVVGSAGYTYSWSNGVTTVGTGSPLILNPTAAATYTATVTDANGCTITSSPVSITILPVLNTPNGTNSTQCGPHVPSCSVSTASATTSPIFKWYLVPANGTALAGQSGATLTGYTIYATTTFYVSEVNVNGCESPRKAVTATITTPPALATTAPSIGICTGASITLTSTSSLNPTYTYSWTPGPLSGSSVTVSPSATTTYYVTASATTGTYAGCIALDSIKVFVNPQPNPPVLSPVTQTVCQNTPGVVVATPATSPILVTIGTGTVTNSTSGYPTPYGQFYGSDHGQFLVLASELIAQGVTAGNITSVAFDLALPYTYTPLSNFAVYMAPTALTGLPTAITSAGMINVYSASVYTPPNATGFATITFTTPFAWNGISNVIVDVSFSNCSVCNGTSSCTTAFTSNGTVNQTATTFVSSYDVHADGNCTINSFAPSITGTAYNQRPNMRFTGAKPFPVNWLNTASLFKNAALSQPMGAVDTNTIGYSMPAVSASYTAVSNVQGCLSVPSNTATVNVNAAPLNTVTPSASPVAICAGLSTTFTGPTPPAGTTYSYQWKNGTTNIGGATNVSYSATAAGTYTLVVTNTATGCQNTSAAIVVTVNPLPTVTVTPAGPTTFCNGASVVLNSNSATGFSYQWKQNGTNVGANSSAFTATTSGNYTMTITDGNGCINTSTPPTVVTVNTTPTAITAGGTTTFCVGGNVTLTAPTGTGFTYAWQLNGGAISGATNISYVATATGSYSVFVTNPATGCSATTNPPTIVTVGPPPSSAITPSGSVGICQGYTTTLTTNTAPGLQYNWFNNGVLIPGANSATYAASTAGSYTAQVISGPGCSSTTNPAVTTFINPVPTSSAVATGGTTICQGFTVPMTGSTTTTGTSYQWQLNGSSIPGATGNTYSATANGNYTFVVTINSTGCYTPSTAIPVTVNPLPPAVATAAGLTTFCQGSSVAINANTGTSLGYQWKQNGNVLSGATNSTYTATTTGSYTVQVTNLITGCVNTSNAIGITVNPLPNVTVTPSGNVNLCTGSSLSMNVPPAAGTTFQWISNGVNITGANTNAYTTSVGATYTVFVTTNATGCNATSLPTVVTIVPLPTATTTPSAPSTACDSLVMTANSGTGLTYLWNINGIGIPGATNTTYSATTSANYSVTVTNNNGCIKTSTPVSITINPSPISVITYATPLVFCKGGAVALNCYTSNGLTFQWQLGATPIPGATNATYIANQTGVFSALVTNQFGCTRASGIVQVTVNALPTPVITRNAYTLGTGNYMLYQWYYNSQPIGGASGQTYVTTQDGGYYVSVTDSNGCQGVSNLVFINNTDVHSVNPGAGIRIYPNPTHDYVNIEAPMKVNATIRDMQGRTVLIATEAKQIDISSIADGVYMILISDEKGNLLRMDKLVKTQ